MSGPGSPPQDAPLPRERRPLPWLHLLLFAGTAATTVVAGAAFTEEGAVALARLFSLRPALWPGGAAGVLQAGWPYSAALLAFFLSHEMGHYLACRYHRIPCTLPYFIPAPPFFLFGTFGAVIRIRGAIPSRRTLFDIGVAGPIAGFAVAVPVLLVGLARSTPAAAAPSGPAWVFGDSLLTWWLQRLVHPGLAGADLEADPVFLAGWLGVLATAMNLIPAGQFDGGHVLYALAPRWHRPVSLASGLFLVSVVVTRALAHHEASAWSAWAVVVLLLGRRHPFVPGDGRRLGPLRLTLAAAAALILLACFIPNPIGVTGL